MSIKQNSSRPQNAWTTATSNRHQMSMEEIFVSNHDSTSPTSLTVEERLVQIRSTLRFSAFGKATLQQTLSQCLW